MRPRCGPVSFIGAERLGHDAIGIVPFETRTFKGKNGENLFVTATPARQGPLGIDVGDVVGLALGVRKRGDLIYITGDTLWF
jgi:hypothetical protein